MERLSIRGDFFDCQLYDGRLYLWTFDGDICIYNYSKIINWWNEKKPQKSKCQKYEYDDSTLFIPEDIINNCLIYKRDYLSKEFPVGIEFMNGILYEANQSGLYYCKAPLHSSLPNTYKISDTPLISANAAQYRGIVFAGGSDGVFILPQFNNNRLINLTQKAANNATFCSPGIFATSTDESSYLLVNNGLSNNKTILQEDLFRLSSDVKSIDKILTWCWKNYFYLAAGSTLSVYKYNKIINGLKLFRDIKFWSWKGDFVSAGSSNYATVVELENAVFITDDVTNSNSGTTFSGSCTRWRLYPRSKTFKNHIHLIFDDRIDIVVIG